MSSDAPPIMAAGAGGTTPIPASALMWSNIAEAVYTSDIWGESEVQEWLDSVWDDLEVANIRATPYQDGDSRIPQRVRV